MEGVTTWLNSICRYRVQIDPIGVEITKYWTWTDGGVLDKLSWAAREI